MASDEPLLIWACTIWVLDSVKQLAKPIENLDLTILQLMLSGGKPQKMGYINDVHGDTRKICGNEVGIRNHARLIPITATWTGS